MQGLRDNKNNQSQVNVCWKHASVGTWGLNISSTGQATPTRMTESPEWYRKAQAS